MVKERPGGHQLLMRNLKDRNNEMERIKIREMEISSNLEEKRFYLIEA